jgi:hypothetical protein
VEDDRPRSLKNAGVRERRLALLAGAHVAPLVAFAADIRARRGVEVPHFDPLDGGINATILFLMEKPGPMTDASGKGRAGSGFISRNNDDPTAEATFHFMNSAGIPRCETLIWNVIPWWDGHIRFTAADRAGALSELSGLVSLLPRLQTVVLVGRTAGKARVHLPGLRVLDSPHPSPKVRSTNRALWDSIPERWREARSLAPGS